MQATRRRPPGDVLATGAVAGLVAGFATGLIDAIWSWAPAEQFVQGLGRLRFALYVGLSLGAAGALIGLVTAAVLLGLSRGTRIGDLARFGWREHAARRARDPRDAVVGLSLVLAGLPLVAAAIAAVYRVMTPIVIKSHALGLAVLAVIAATLVALAIAFVLMFVVGRVVELGLQWLAPRVPIIASPWAPLVVLGALLALALAVWAWRERATVRVLPLRGPLVACVAALLAIPAQEPAREVVARIAAATRWLRLAIWIALAPVLVFLVLATGGSSSVIKASTAYTGLGAPIARTLRKVLDRDRDGFSPFLGGGDCDDGDRGVHPGAIDIPDDGIDQNCVGGDAHMAAPAPDAAFAAVPASVPKDANILLVTIDTTRADHLGMYGYKRATSPNLDAMAAQGTVFESGWAHAPSTRYSMPAILTGRLPLDVYYDTTMAGWPGLSLKATTLGEELGPLGFLTGAITNYEYFTPARRMNQGFAEYDNDDARLHGGVTGAGPERTHGSSSKEQTDKAIAFVERHHDQRWFLWVHYYDPHADYETHAGIPSFGDDDMARYDGEIRYTDLHLGRLLDALRAKGLYDKTIIVVTGDHGEGFGEHHVRMHGYDLYSAQTKVPLVIRVPGLSPRRARTPAGHVDIMPTLVNLAGGPPNPDMMGRSLVDVLTGSDRERVVLQQLSYEDNHEMRAAVDAHCHVIYHVSPETSWEVYRVDRDPLERFDLSGGGECATTRHAFEDWYDRQQIPAGAANALLPSRPAIAAPLDVDFDGGTVRLLAVDAPAHAKPGEAITLTWTFEARGRVAGWKVFAHAEGPAFVNGDHKPARPFEWWRPGQFIRYSTTITLPTPGTYTVRMGLFQGNRRAAAVSPHTPIQQNAAEVAKIEVVP